MFRLAHFSDIHVTVPPTSLGVRALFSKRIGGFFSYYLSGRKRHFHQVEARIEALLADVDAQNVDHALCTGDLTAVSAEVEFDRVAALFGQRLRQPKRYTVMPGNHDRYVHEAVNERFFESRFGDLCGEFPLAKRLGPNLLLIAIDVARPTSLLHSSGYFGARMAESTRALIAQHAQPTDLVVFAVHYGLLRPTGKRDHASHRVQGDVELLRMVNDPSLHIDVVVHGHIHGAYDVMSPLRPLVCAGGATDLYRRCGYNIYTLDAQQRTLAIERRVYDAKLHRYVSAPELARHMTLR